MRYAYLKDAKDIVEPALNVDYEKTIALLLEHIYTELSGGEYEIFDSGGGYGISAERIAAGNLSASRFEEAFTTAVETPLITGMRNIGRRLRCEIVAAILECAGTQKKS
jgi:hypothetical protein